jgi:hypothetical protein
MRCLIWPMPVKLFLACRWLSCIRCSIGELDHANFQKLTRRFRGDVAARRLRVIRLTAAHFQSAERLIRRIGPSKNLRTLDALQLAVAINLSEPGQPIEFVCADHAFCTLAIAEGLLVVNPEVI